MGGTYNQAEGRKVSWGVSALLTIIILAAANRMAGKVVRRRETWDPIKPAANQKGSREEEAVLSHQVLQRHGRQHKKKIKLGISGGQKNGEKKSVRLLATRKKKIAVAYTKK